MKRRNFLTWMGVSGLATSLPLAIAACTPSESDSGAGTEENATSSNPGEAPEESTVASNASAITVGTLSELDAQGSLVVEDPDKVIVIRDPNNADDVIALTANCNHQNCTVGWEAESNQFVCPCHQSKFAIDGTIEQGPATQPLQVLPATVEGDTVQVSV